MKMKHTPGPWVLHPTACYPAVRSVGTADIGPKRICTVGTMGKRPVDWANARLIAAAPDLLAALEAILSHPVSVVTVQLMQDAIAAIDKAEGRS